jgi:oligoendopeptidase F
MSRQPNIARTEVAPEHQWQLDHLFPNLGAWDAEYAQVKELVIDMIPFKGNLQEPGKLRACFELEDKISQLAERLYVYANMKHHEDTTEPTYQALSDKTKKLSVEVGEALSFITPEILALPEATIREFIGNAELAPYKHTLEEMLRQQAHVLSAKEEALLAQVGNLSQAPNTIFGMLNNADLKFPNVKDETGTEQPLTHGSYIQFLENANRDVRKNAFQAVYKTYASQKNTLAATLSANVNKNLFYSKARKFPSALEMSLYSDNIPKEVYTNLISTIHEHLPLMYRYMEMRKNLLQLEELHMYDLFTPLASEVKMVIPFEEAQKMVIESLAPLGNDYVAVLTGSFEQGWIDKYENKGKRSGAYSWGAYGTHPYVLLNHKDNLNSMFTLTHEMGHAMHSYLSDENQPYREAQYTIFLAEVASTLNEALLMDYLLKRTTDLHERLYLLTYYADQFRTTVFRQTMFAEFEMLIHEQAEQGNALTPQLLSEIYYSLNEKYYGPGMIVDKDIEMEWARIPHFYTSFYVYKYATGFSAATSFAKQILDEGEPAVARYLGFLKSGGSDFSINILSKAGVDMSSPKPIEQAMSVFAFVLDELDKTIAALNN